MKAFGAVAAAIAVLGAAGCTRRARAFSPDAALLFVDAERREERAILARELPLERIASVDPYYGREKHYWAAPLAPVLRRGLPGVDLARAELVLRAGDGYAVPIEGARLLDDRAYLAVADADRGGWEPIGPRRADPGAFYLVWRGGERTDLERYPRPWALARIERVRFEDAYPHTAPEEGDAPARRGYAIFRRDCIRCHAINREGGRVGPELNVPQSIVEYRPAAQIRAYIRDPLAFRYGAMPAHPQLTDGNLDDLLAYFQAMSHAKVDPDRAVRELAR